MSGELKVEIQNGFERAIYALQDVVEHELRAASALLAEEKKAHQLDAKDKGLAS